MPEEQVIESVQPEVSNVETNEQTVENVETQQGQEIINQEPVETPESLKAKIAELEQKLSSTAGRLEKTKLQRPMWMQQQEAAQVQQQQVQQQQQFQQSPVQPQSQTPMYAQNEFGLEGDEAVRFSRAVQAEVNRVIQPHVQNFSQLNQAVVASQMIAQNRNDLQNVYGGAITHQDVGAVMREAGIDESSIKEVELGLYPVGEIAGYAMQALNKKLSGKQQTVSGVAKMINGAQKSSTPVLVKGNQAQKQSIVSLLEGKSQEEVAKYFLQHPGASKEYRKELGI